MAANLPYIKHPRISLARLYPKTYILRPRVAAAYRSYCFFNPLRLSRISIDKISKLTNILTYYIVEINTSPDSIVYLL